MYIASIRGVQSIAQPVLLHIQSVNKRISYQSDVLPILCVVLIPSTVQCCTHPEYGTDDFYVLVQQLEAWRNSIAAAFKLAAQIIGGVSGRCTVSVICNASRR